jgi:Carboxypeptidase regulatory-like domain
MIRQSSYAITSGIVLLSLFFTLTSTARSQSGTISGKVKDQGGKTLEGVIVQARKVEEKSAEDSSNRAASRAAKLTTSSEKHETKTTGKGEFSLSDLSAGNYVLSFEKPGFLAVTTWQMTVKAGEVIQLGKPVELPREKQVETSLVRGAVFNSEGFTLPNATIKIERIGEGRRFKRETVSIEGGEFSFRVPSERGTYRVTATASGFQPAVREVEIDVTEIRQISLTLAKKK